MSTGASQRDIGPEDTGPGAGAGPPLAADRPFVDGTSASPEELRAEVERLSDEDRQHMDDLREEVGDSVAELTERLDVKARVVEKKDDAVATVKQQAGRARTVATDTARQKPGTVAAAAAGLLALLVVVVLGRRRR